MATKTASAEALSFVYTAPSVPFVLARQRATAPPHSVGRTMLSTGNSVEVEVNVAVRRCPGGTTKL